MRVKGGKPSHQRAARTGKIPPGPTTWLSLAWYLHSWEAALSEAALSEAALRSRPVRLTHVPRRPNEARRTDSAWTLTEPIPDAHAEKAAVDRVEVQIGALRSALDTR